MIYAAKTVKNKFIRNYIPKKKIQQISNRIFELIHINLITYTEIEEISILIGNFNKLTHLFLVIIVIMIEL